MSISADKDQTSLFPLEPLTITLQYVLIICCLIFRAFNTSEKTAS